MNQVFVLDTHKQSLAPIHPAEARQLLRDGKATTGHGRRQRCGTDRYGFPHRHVPRAKSFLGLQTGGIVRARILGGKYVGTHVGRMAIRFRPTCRLNGFDVHPRYLTCLHRADGYTYG